MKLFLPLVFLIFSSRAGAQSNNALYFDADARVTGLSGISPAQFTIEFWVLLDYSGNLYQGVYWSNNAADERGIFVEQNHTISLWSQAVVQYNSSTALNLSQWSHVAFSYDGSQLKIYINGLLKNTITVSGLQIPLTNVTMGYGNGIYGDYDMANSALDEFRIWNVARTQAQIQANMNSQLSLPQTGLVRYYNFNQGVGGGNNTGVTTLPDVTTNSSGGILAGFTLTGNTSNWISDIGPLPLTLLSFEGSPSGSDIRLQWITSAEINVQRFEIEKSSSGEVVLKKVAELPARNTVGVKNIYDWTDYGASAIGNNLYRLKMIDIDGKFTYSNVINVRGGKASTELKIYYLGGNGKAFGLQMPQGAPMGNYSLGIYNTSGMLVQKQELAYNSYSTIYHLGLLPSSAAPGIYTVVLNKGTYMLSKNLLVQ
jgi:hypothetical protein